MTAQGVQYTLFIFEKLFEQMPPLVPKEVQTSMAKALEQAHLNMSLSLDDLEETMIFFGKQLWPYREAYQEFLRIYEGKLGEPFIIQKMSLSLKKKYQAFLLSGGTFRDLHSGAPALFFSSEERGELCELLVNLEKDLRRYTKQAVLSNDRRVYEKKVKEFALILEHIEEQLRQMHELANQEREHPELVAEIKEHIRGFEHGLCLLGPSINYDAVCSAVEHFHGRKRDKTLHRSLVLSV